MYRIIGKHGKYYALKISSIEDDIENIEIFTSSSEPVIICNDISDLTDFGIDEDEVEIVEPD